VITEEMGYVRIVAGTTLWLADGEKKQHVDIGPGPNSHTWGAVLLSKVTKLHTFDCSMSQTV